MAVFVPGFPQGPVSPLLPLLMVLLAMVGVVAAICFAVLTRRRGGSRRGLVIQLIVALAAAVVVAGVLLSSPTARVGPETAAGPASCPMSAINGSFMRNPDGTAMTTADFWAPCRGASRRTLGALLGSLLVFDAVFYSRTLRRKPNQGRGGAEVRPQLTNP